MTPFWNSLFDHLKGCGRNATLFMFALAAFFGLLILAAVVFTTEIRQYLLPALGIPGILALIWLSREIRRARVRRRERLQRGPLSDDELRVAREKLQKAKVLREQ